MRRAHDGCTRTRTIPYHPNAWVRRGVCFGRPGVERHAHSSFPSIPPRGGDACVGKPRVGLMPMEMQNTTTRSFLGDIDAVVVGELDAGRSLSLRMADWTTGWGNGTHSIRHTHRFSFSALPFAVAFGLDRQGSLGAPSQPSKKKNPHACKRTPLTTRFTGGRRIDINKHGPPGQGANTRPQSTHTKAGTFPRGHHTLSCALCSMIFTCCCLVGSFSHTQVHRKGTNPLVRTLIFFVPLFLGPD